MAKPLRVRPSVFATLLTDHESDSLFRLNHCPSATDGSSSSSFHHGNTPIRFGEHSDPRILTLLTSNGVPGLQISLGNGVWVPVNSDRQAFCVTVGDLLQSDSNEFKPDGAGRGNWGTQSDEITQETEEVVVVEGDKTEKPLTEEEHQMRKRKMKPKGKYISDIDSYSSFNQRTGQMFTLRGFRLGSNKKMKSSRISWPKSP